MEQIKIFLKKYRYGVVAILLTIIFILYVYFYLLPYGWLSFTYFWFRYLLILLLFVGFVGFYAKQEQAFSLCIEKLSGLGEKYVKKGLLLTYFLEILLALVLSILIAILITILPHRRVSVTLTGNTGNTNNVGQSPQAAPVSFNEGQSNGRIWIGAMSKKNQVTTLVMHATYTAEFGYYIQDPTRYATKVEITNITAKSKLPSYEALKILPYSSLKKSENGGSISSVNLFEDWNVPFGYIYYEDYLRLPSLDKTYTPEFCEGEYSCDQHNQVAKKSGYLGLRFKYLGVSTTQDTNCASTLSGFRKCFGIEPNTLDGTFTWRMTITLDDGSTYYRDYVLTLKGNSIPGDSNSSAVVLY